MFEDETEEAQSKINEAKLIRAKAYHHTFTTADGQKVLEEWVTRFCTGVVPDGNATARECAMRDGKQALIKEILDQIAIATNNYGE